MTQDADFFNDGNVNQPWQQVIGAEYKDGETDLDIADNIFEPLRGYKLHDHQVNDIDNEDAEEGSFQYLYKEYRNSQRAIYKAYHYEAGRTLQQGEPKNINTDMQYARYGDGTITNRPGHDNKLIPGIDKHSGKIRDQCKCHQHHKNAEIKRLSHVRRLI